MSEHLSSNFVPMFSMLNLTQLIPPAFFYTIWKHKKTEVFLIFSWGLEKDQWHEMGSLQSIKFDRFSIFILMEIVITTIMGGCKALRENCPNTEFFWSVFSCIQSEYRKKRTRKTPYLDNFQPEICFD